jgi:hypothetical protein
MNNVQPHGAAQRLIVEQMDLLLGRLEQLGRQLGNTVARILGTTVADAVSEAIRLVLRLVPHRKPSSDRCCWRDGDSYDPYEGDGYGQHYQDEHEDYLPVVRSSWQWRRLMSRVICFAAGMIARLKSWKVARLLSLGGAAILEYLILMTPAETGP